MSRAPVGSAGSAAAVWGGCRYVLIAHRTVREIAVLVGLSVEEVTHELEGYVLCAPSSAAVPLPRSVPATLRGVDSPPRSGRWPA